MGQAKREAERQEQMHHVVVEIAKKTDLLYECEAHGYTISTGEVDFTSAYKYANTMYSNNDPRTEIFKNRNELTDTIKRVVEDYGTTCPGCEKVDRE